MCIDIYDSTTPDYRIIESAEIMEIFGLRKRGEVSEAVSAFKLPMPLDYCGFNGSARWSVGQIRQWIMWKGSVQNELSKQSFVSAWKAGTLPGQRRRPGQACDGDIQSAVDAVDFGAKNPISAMLPRRKVNASLSADHEPGLQRERSAFGSHGVFAPHRTDPYKISRID